MATQRIISRNTSAEELDSDYKWGFTIDIEEDAAPKGLNEDIVRLISSKKNEPEWLLEWRLKAYKHFLDPEWDGEPLNPEESSPGIPKDRVIVDKDPKDPEENREVLFRMALIPVDEIFQGRKVVRI